MRWLLLLYFTSAWCAPPKIKLIDDIMGLRTQTQNSPPSLTFRTTTSDPSSKFFDPSKPQPLTGMNEQSSGGLDAMSYLRASEDKLKDSANKKNRGVGFPSIEELRAPQPKIEPLFDVTESPADAEAEKKEAEKKKMTQEDEALKGIRQAIRQSGK